MFIKNIDKKNKELTVAIPLTKGTEKTRIKNRLTKNEYGIPHSTRSVKLNQNCYVEWQIGYDVIKSDTKKLAKTTLPNFSFVGANGKEKTFYELSEYVKYFYDWGVIEKQVLLDIISYLKNLNNDDLLDKNPQSLIMRSTALSKKINNFEYTFSKVQYPILIHNFTNSNLIIEIIIKEKQYAIGTQPMLYLCFPISELKTTTALVGRTAEKLEKADFMINQDNIAIFVEILKIFGTLSENHKKDIITIIETILK